MCHRARAERLAFAGMPHHEDGSFAAPSVAPLHPHDPAGFEASLSALSEHTRRAYAHDAREFVAWCDQHDLKLFAVRRADIECFARDLEARGRATATVARRLSTVAGFYRYADEEGLLSPSPAAARP